MSYEEKEASVSSGTPRELFAFYIQGRAWRYTSADTLVENGAPYRSVDIQRSEIQANEENSSFSMDIVLDRTLSLARVLVEENPVSPCWLIMYRLHEEAETAVHFQGQVASFSVQGEKVVLHCASMQQAMEKKIPRFRFQRICNHILYDRGCGLDPEDFKVAAEVTYVLGTNVSVTWSGSHATWPGGAPEGWGAAGMLHKPSTGQRQFIVSHPTNLDMVLLSPMVGLLVGDDVEVFAGCTRTPEMCQERFDNLSRFVGFPNIPEINPFNRIV